MGRPRGDGIAPPAVSGGVDLMSRPEGEGIRQPRRTGQRFRWPFAIGIVAAVVAGALVVGIALNVAAPPVGQASASASPTEGPAASQAPSETPSPASSVAPTSEPTRPVSAGWQEAAMFGGPGVIEQAHSVTRTADGFIAVGTHYDVETMPHAGPVPQEGRVWHSTDGRSWNDVTPSDTFADADLTHVSTIP